jgi:hypothetical protein
MYEMFVGSRFLMLFMNLSHNGFEQLEQNLLLHVKFTTFFFQQQLQLYVANPNSQDLHFMQSSIQLIPHFLMRFVQCIQ